MLNRKYNLKLDLQFRCNNSNMEFNQFDKNTSDFFMQINRSGKEIDLSKALVTLMVVKPNGSVDSQFLEIGENGVYANLKPSLKDIPGDYQCKAIITMKDETVIPEQIFTYTVNEDKFLAAFNSNIIANEDYSLLTDILGRLSSIETDEQQRQINEAERILSEEARKVSENARVEAELTREHNDADREKSEATRESNEHDRKLAEISRAKVELARVEAEDNRVDAEALRVEAEKLRNDNYSFMTSDEERRRSEENSRIEAEKLRVQAEKARVNEESQRRTTEQSRVLKENERNSKELEREDNELERKSNESKRVQAESNRVDRYNNFINDAESATNSFKSYTSTAKQDEEIRKNNELARVESEDRRVSNELERISSENTRKVNEGRRVEAENNRQSKFNSKISEVENKVIEVNVAKDTVIANTKEAINTMKEDVANAIAAGTQDLEVKEARKDLSGKTHESLKLRIASDFEGLKESQDMAYTTDKGYLVCKETKNGTVKDLKIRGKSLVNLCNPIAKSKTLGTDMSFTICNFDFIAGREYTLFVKFNNNTATSVNSNDLFLCQTSLSYDNNISVSEAKGWFCRKITAKANESKWVMGARTSFNGTVECSDFMILEGDHTQNPPSYFEGVTSVGNGVDKIEVSSVKSSGNLFDKNALTKFIIGNDDDGVVLDYLKMYRDKFVYPIYAEDQITVTYSAKELVGGKNPRFIIMYSDGSEDSITFKVDSTMNSCSRTSDKSKRVVGIGVMYTAADGKWVVDLDSIIVNKGTQAIPYEPYKEDRKPILFKDTGGTWRPVAELRGLDTVCDTIELHSDGKYYYHQRTVNGVLDGTHVIKSIDQLSNTNKVQIDIQSFKLATNKGGVLNLICDKINARQGNDDAAHIRTDRTAPYANLVLWLDKKHGDTKEAINKSLTSNPITFIGELVEEKVFEVNPLFLEVYEGETMMTINGGTINAPMEFKLTSSLPNLTRNLQLRIDNLENEIYKSQELQNIMLLENDLRLMDLEFALLESMPIKLNLRSDVMFAKGITEFEFLKGRILSGSHTDEYLEKCINKYKKAGRLTEEEYDILYDMIYPPVYDILADK